MENDDKEPISLSLSKSTIAKIKEEAEKDARSASNYVDKVLRDHWEE